MRIAIRPFLSKVLPGIILASLLILGVRPFIEGAGHLGTRSLTLDNNQPSATATYNFLLTTVSTDPVGSIELQVCANDPLIEDPCTAPSGFSFSGATLTTQTGITGFTISNNSTANTLILTRTSTPIAPNTAAAYTLSGVKNPDTAGSYYARLQTFSSNDASGSNVDYGGLAFVIAKNFTVSAQVPPYLLFCSGVTITGYDCNTATGDYLQLGELTPTHTTTGTSQMLVATNGETGYAIHVSGTTLTSGNNAVAALTSPDVSRPGTAQFGINLVANGTPAVGLTPAGPGHGAPSSLYGSSDYYTFRNGDEVASYNAPEDFRKYTVSYIINIPKGQAPGIYASTLTYVCMANF